MERQQEFNEAWAEGANAQILTRGDMLFLALNKAMNTYWVNENQLLHAFSKEIQKTFTPTTDVNKISNGYGPWKAVELALVEGLSSPGWSFLNDDEFTAYGNIYGAMTKYLVKQFEQGVVNVELPEADYLYITVRKDLSPEQQVVQAAHAAFIAGVRFGGDPQSAFTDPEAVRFVVLHAEDEEELLEAFDFDAEKVNFGIYSYYERDLHEFTAVSSQVITGKDRKAFEGKPLLKFDRTPVEIVFKPENAVAFSDVKVDEDGLVFVPGWGAFDAAKFDPIVMGSGDSIISNINSTEPVATVTNMDESKFIGGWFTSRANAGFRTPDSVYAAEYAH